ncbi:MAG: DUF4159 domain-containing protein [Vicinamibacterales bacterium]|nr:transmembrane prediction [Acidobacteriota bacterium]MDP6372031.1 DUF4159 domain-containing protein [Vicinamibacterales bacterium]MDP6610306.1 DUF4159 domain-containing protein [Vicinamibacterales bacterium]HAK55215.1 transmembrane prediction [Acidobacteriota bacterium]
MTRRPVWIAATLLLIIAAASIVDAQYGRRGYGWRRRTPPRFASPGESDRAFAFSRAMYQSVRREWLGTGWDTDYPDSDYNFMIRLSELTRTPVSFDGNQPNHVVVQLTDDAVFEYPFLFMSDVGTALFSPEEAEGLRRYLELGGFLWVDDFWGPTAWAHWEEQIGRVLPSSQYPIRDLPLSHPLFTSLYKVEKIPQVPSIQFWRRSGGSSTSERGDESGDPHFRGISDADGRLMVFMSHNTDIADGWEREGESTEFFHLFSIDSYAVGINVVLYAMSH